MEEPRSHADVPAGITFGRKVAVIPDTSSEFDRPLWVQACIANPQPLQESYTWVKRGDYLAKYVLFLPRTGIAAIDFFAPRRHEVYLRSPVSGLLLGTVFNFGAGHRPDNSLNASLLLPDDEPPAEGGRYMFHDLCAVCWDYREHIFYKPSDFRDGLFNDQGLRQAFDEQQARSCKYVDAMPDFESYFQSARTKFPQLRPLLKHLL